MHMSEKLGHFGVRYAHAHAARSMSDYGTANIEGAEPELWEACQAQLSLAALVGTSEVAARVLAVLEEHFGALADIFLAYAVADETGRLVMGRGQFEDTIRDARLLTRHGCRLLRSDIHTRHVRAERSQLREELGELGRSHLALASLVDRGERGSRRRFRRRVKGVDCCAACACIGYTLHL